MASARTTTRKNKDFSSKITKKTRLIPNPWLVTTGKQAAR
jgi:hypothetical protein